MVDNCETDLYCETLEIRRSVLCIICLSTYCNPATLPCSHTFCRHCILEASRVRLKCPICSADFTKRSLVSETHFSRVVADVVGLVNSLTSKLRYSISIDALDGFYRERQRITVPRNTPVVSEQPAQGLIHLTPLLTAQSNIAGEVNRDGIISGRREISNVPDLNFEYCTVDEKSLLNRKYSTGIVLVKETIQVLNERNHEKMEYAETSSSQSGNETYCDNLNERIYAETIDFIGCKEVTEACVYEFPVHLPCSNLQQKEDDNVTCMSSVVDMKDRDAKDVEVETPAPAVFLPGDLVTVIARMWPGMNKPGGTAWILSSHTNDSDLLNGIKASISYDVKYVLHGQSDRDVPETFVELFQELERKSRKRGIETVLPLLSPVPQKKEKRVKILKELSPNITPNISNTKEILRDVLKSAGCTESLLSSKIKTPTDNNQFNVLKKTDYSTFKKITRKASTQLAAKHGIVKKNICVSHTSLEITDFAKLEKFLIYFSASNSEDCGAPTVPPLSSLALSASSSSSSSSTSTSSSSVAPILMDVSRTLQHVERTTLNGNSGLRLSDKFDKSVTHLIVSTDKKGVLRKRTLKFMQAIMAGIWIVSPQWLADSVTAGEILLEHSYEVPGYQKAGKELAPKRARLAVHAERTRKSLTVYGTSEIIIKTSELSSNHENYPNVTYERFHSTEKYLFENTVFLLYGSFPNSGPPRSEIADLLKTGKACVVTSIKDLCVKLKARDPRFNSTSVSKQDCYKGMGMGGMGAGSDSNSSVSSCSDCCGRNSNDKAFQYQSTEGSKIVVCTDSHSVLTFLEELSGFLSQASDPSLKKDSPGNMESLKKRPCIRLKISSKYPIEGSDAYACLIEKINLMLLEVNLDDDKKTLSCNKENDENQSNCVAGREYGVKEITILNPTWVFDSISDYSIMSTA